MSTRAQRKEIVECIGFYSMHGWDWTLVVEYLCAKANGWKP